MRCRPRSLLLFITLALAACIPTAPSPHGLKSGGHTPSQEQSTNLLVRDQSTENEIVFSVRDGDKTFTDYGISHTREMHLILVRDDLQHFQHLHPERDSEGVWRVAFTPPAGGTYWRYADFVGTDEHPYTIRFNTQVPGNPGTYGIAKNFATVKTFDEYRFTFKHTVTGDDVIFTYDITDDREQPVQLEEYLGATGHSVLISPSGDFIHTHPSEEGETPVFATAKPSDDFYRVFTQFQIKGGIVTVDFDWRS